MEDPKDDMPIAFALMIRPYLDIDGKVRYLIKSNTREIHDEIVLSMVEAWLRGVKDEYYKNIRAGMSF